ncbi:hypothetical protein P7G58_07900 [Globicatella sulfidifaciens]|uniref:hypothetical protein n=1 Tax=Globicatella sulfidifaciens TaxID=136093 RepID=UPI0028915CB3|nr:hypothetical protein [Globicatella sulfidifaciens]MDT2768772.1 hypothetical protein [Globicatella sulfidifaciens]
MSELKLCLNEVKDNFGKLNQVIVIKLKAQWLSGLNMRLNDLFETYSTVRGVNRRSENHLIFYFWFTPNCAGWADEAKIIQFPTSGLLPTLRG